MTEDAIRKVAHGFLMDRDDDWIQYLPHEKKTEIRRKRAQYHEIKDGFDKFLMAHDTDMKKLPVSDRVGKAKLTKVFNENRPKYQRILDKFLKKSLKDLQELKREANQLREESFKAEGEAILKRRKYNLENENVVEVEVDNDQDCLSSYMPRPPPEEKKPIIRELPIDHDPQPGPSLQETPSVDPLIDGVPEVHRPLILNLKPFINKYKCRDRVLKTLDAVKRQEQHVDCMKALILAVERFHADQKNHSISGQKRDK